MGRLLLLLAATTLTASSFGGCTWRTHASDKDDDETWWDHGSCDCDSKGDLGDSCDVDCDCSDGLTCDDYAGVCGPPTFETCSAHGDCLPGSYCNEEAGECHAGDVCIDDGMCLEGFICLVEQLVCLPVQAPPACAELLDEAACSERDDCEAKYVGVNCGCGSGCECSSGEDGCVCESFDFDGCVDLVE